MRSSSKRWLISVLVLIWTVGTVQAQNPDRGSDRHVREMIQQALDDALADQVQHLFAAWMKDDTGQPKRAAAGIRKAVRSYRQAVHAIETEQLTWQSARKRDARLR